MYSTTIMGMEEQDKDISYQIVGRVEGSIYDVIQHTGQRAENIFIGDTDHSNLAIREFLGSEEFIKALAGAGVVHIGLEFPVEFNESVQKYQDGEIDKDELRKGLKAFVVINEGEVSQEDFIDSVLEAMDHAQTNYIRGHLVDSGVGASEVYQALRDDLLGTGLLMLSIFDCYNQEHGDVFSASIDKNGDVTLDYEGITEEQANSFIHQIRDKLLALYREDPEAQEKYDDIFDDIDNVESIEDMEFLVFVALKKGYFKELGYDPETFGDVIASNDYLHSLNEAMEKRFNDSELHDNIQKVADGEKFALIYGSGHDHITDLILGNNLVIDIVSSRDYADFVNDLDTPRESLRGQPDFVYVIDEDAIYVTNRAESLLTEGLKIVSLEEELAPVTPKEDPLLKVAEVEAKSAEIFKPI